MHDAVKVLNILISLFYFASVQTPVSDTKYRGEALVSHSVLFQKTLGESADIKIVKK